MNIIETELPGVLIIEPRVFSDRRGCFLEVFHERRYREAGIPGAGRRFVQDNYSRSERGVLRGLHFQRVRPQGKLVLAGVGRVYDVVADIDRRSPTFGRWIGVELSEENHRQLWIPPGYAHGFCVLSAHADFQYKCTEFYHPELDAGVVWNDPTLAIDWPIDDPVLSDKDRALPTLRQLDLEP
ncbi:MAG: dTDP-4-dehydrorhamnose 3,5-epimerase [Zetaproteobacteria bacterium]|nr:MAG: dTDP-4-dehydrorhamnose 3,5-epimerase [Zetaproteobacteria bacterium]